MISACNRFRLGVFNQTSDAPPAQNNPPLTLTQNRLNELLQVIRSVGDIDCSDKRYQHLLTPKQALDKYVQEEASRVTAQEERDSPFVEIINLPCSESDLFDDIFECKI